jgi:ribosomal protein S18 acetylase RimI-like enzyme
MDDIIVRDAKSDEAPTIVRMIRHMVTDMAGYGGYAPAIEDTAWNSLITRITEELKGGQSKYLVAESSIGGPIGSAAAELIDLHGVFAPMKTMHISVVYVLPQHRRGGIGATMLEKLLDWGRAAGARQCDLNVLASNPANALYRKHGFSLFEVKLVRSLQDGSGHRDALSP